MSGDNPVILSVLANKAQELVNLGRYDEALVDLEKIAGKT